MLFTHKTEISPLAEQSKCALRENSAKILMRKGMAVCGEDLSQSCRGCALRWSDLRVTSMSPHQLLNLSTGRDLMVSPLSGGPASQPSLHSECWRYGMKKAVSERGQWSLSWPSSTAQWRQKQQVPLSYGLREEALCWEMCGFNVHIFFFLLLEIIIYLLFDSQI